MIYIKNQIILWYAIISCLFLSTAYSQSLSYKQLKELIKVNANNADSSALLNEQLIKLIEKDTSKTEDLIIAYLDLSEAYLRIGKIPAAMTYCSDAALAAQKHNKSYLLSRSYYSKARLYIRQEKFPEAIEYFKKGLVIVEQLGKKKETAQFLSQIGYGFANVNQLDSAIYFQTKALYIRESLNDSIGMASSYSNIGYVYYLKGELNKTKDYYYKAADYRKSSPDKYMLASSFIDCASVEQELGNPIKCIELMRKALDIIKVSKNFLLESKCYQSIAYSYEEMNKIDSAYKYHKLFKTSNDSVFNEENIKAISDLENKYLLSSKQNEIDLLSEKNKNNELQVAKEKMIKWFFVIGLLLLGIILIMVYKQLKTKKEAFNKITEQKIIIEEKQKEMIDSINYAKLIQNTLLASKSTLETNLKDYFILFKPKDIVSGDFYWATKKDDCFYLACCDSTGHGVPGAFMSLLNIGFITEAIKEKNILEPGNIFNYVRQRLIETIGNEGQKDGFDGILIKINATTKQLSYVAANNNPILISDGILTHLPHDKMPVGKGEKEALFTTHQITYKQGDSIYLYTDGYPDQFGGPKGKKLKYKQLESLLLENSNLNTSSQKEKLNVHFENWKGNLEQVDDVCIIGIKL